MTTAEMLRAESGTHRHGEALAEMLTVKFGPFPEGVPKTVHGASIGAINAWAARAVTPTRWTRSSTDQQHTGRTLGACPRWHSGRFLAGMKATIL